MEREVDGCGKCVELELEIRKKIDEYDLLEGKFEALATEKIIMDEELGILKKRNDELEKRISGAENGIKVAVSGGNGKGIEGGVTEKDEGEMVFNLMFENNVLDCEKKKAENEVEFWKAKFKALEERVLEFEGRDGELRLVGKLNKEPVLLEEMSKVKGLKNVLSYAMISPCHQAANVAKDTKGTVHWGATVISTRHQSVKGTEGLQASAVTPLKGALCELSTHVEGGKQGVISGKELECGRRVRKQLAFGELNPSTKMAPSTPGGVRCASLGVIDISDSDGESDQGNVIGSVSLGSIEGGSMNKDNPYCETKIKKTLIDQSDDEEMAGCRGSSPSTKTPKRKRVSNIFTSDTEDEEDDNSEIQSELLPELQVDFQSNICSVPATASGDKVQESAPRRRLVSLRNSTPKKVKRPSSTFDSDTESEHDNNVPVCKFKADLLRESNSDFEFNRCSVAVTVSPEKVQNSVTRRRLTSLRKFEDKWLQDSSQTMNNVEFDHSPGVSTKADDEEAVMEDDVSESEGESLGGFIVDDSDVSVESESTGGLSKNSDSVLTSGQSKDVSDDDANIGEIMSKLRRNRGPRSEWLFEGHMLADFGKDPELCMKAVCALYRQQTSEEKCCKGTIYSNQRGFSHCDAHRGTSLAEFLTDGDPTGDLQKSVKELEAYDRSGIELCRTLANRYSKQLFTIYKNKEDPFFGPNMARV